MCHIWFNYVKGQIRTARARDIFKNVNVRRMGRLMVPSVKENNSLATQKKVLVIFSLFYPYFVNKFLFFFSLHVMLILSI